MIIRGGLSNRDDCPKDKKNAYCWNSFHEDYECETPLPVEVICSKKTHNIPAFENKTVWQCDVCGRLYIFRVEWSKYSHSGFDARWEPKFYQRIMFWERKAND